VKQSKSDATGYPYIFLDTQTQDFTDRELFVYKFDRQWLWSVCFVVVTSSGQQVYLHTIYYLELLPSH